MKKSFAPFAVIFTASMFFFVSCQKTTDNLFEQNTTAPDDERVFLPGQYIVLFTEQFAMPSSLNADVPLDRATKHLYSMQKKTETTKKINSFLTSQNINTNSVLRYYTAAVVGFAAKLTEQQVEKLKLSNSVLLVEQDEILSLPPFTVESVESNNVNNMRSQTTPCGILNAGGPANSSGYTTWIWIVDTGIDLTHPDLNVQTDPAYVYDYSGGNGNDCNGHGTHVSGIAAAIDNGLGVVGVSAGAKVVPVRVLNCAGSGYNSDIIAGLDHVEANDVPGDAVNISLGGFYGNTCSTTSSYITVLNNIGSTGTFVSIAAGNSSLNAKKYQPACVNGTNIFTVAAMSCSKTFASTYSNFGIPPIDFIATGSSVYSTYMGGGYATLTGTSMAAPHVTGITHYNASAPNTCGNIIYGGKTYHIACL